MSPHQDEDFDVAIVGPTGTNNVREDSSNTNENNSDTGEVAVAVTEKSAPLAEAEAAGRDESRHRLQSDEETLVDDMQNVSLDTADGEDDCDDDDRCDRSHEVECRHPDGTQAKELDADNGNFPVSGRAQTLAGAPVPLSPDTGSDADVPVTDQQPQAQKPVKDRTEGSVGDVNDDRTDTEATGSPETVGDDSAGQDGSIRTTPLDYARKAGVAVAGGTMVVVGAIMIPLPTPFGAVIAGSGMAVLGTEFEGAQKVNKQIVSKAKDNFHYARQKLADHIEKTANSMDDEAENDGDNYGSGIAIGSNSRHADGGNPCADGNVAASTMSTPSKTQKQDAVSDEEDMAEEMIEIKELPSSPHNDVAILTLSPDADDASGVLLRDFSTTSTSTATASANSSVTDSENGAAPPCKMSDEQQQQEQQQRNGKYISNARKYFRKQTRSFLTGTVLPVLQLKSKQKTADDAIDAAHDGTAKTTIEEGQEVQLESDGIAVVEGVDDEL